MKAKQNDRLELFCATKRQNFRENVYSGSSRMVIVQSNCTVPTSSFSTNEIIHFIKAAHNEARRRGDTYLLLDVLQLLLQFLYVAVGSISAAVVH